MPNHVSYGPFFRFGALLISQAFDVVLGPLEQDQADVPPEDPSPSEEKVYQDSEGHWVITDVKGLKLGVRWRLDGKGYDIVKSMSIFPASLGCAGELSRKVKLTPM